MDILQAQNPTKRHRALMQLHNKTFVEWFYNRVINELAAEGVSEQLKWFAFGPREDVNKFEGYDVNGYTFYTEAQDEKSSSLQNSGVSVVASSTFFASAKDQALVDPKLLYYGRVQEIWELDYSSFKVALFKCKWVDNNRRCVVKDDPCGFTVVDLARLRDGEEPFILAGQAKQVFYIKDPVNAKKSIVVPGKRFILGVGDVDDEDEYDVLEDSPLFSIPKFKSLNEEGVANGYMHVDHTEGILLDDLL